MQVLKNRLEFDFPVLCTTSLAHLRILSLRSSCLYCSVALIESKKDCYVDVVQRQGDETIRGDAEDDVACIHLHFHLRPNELREW